MAKIKRFGVLKTSYFLGLWGITVGLISVIIFWIFFSLVSSLFAPVISADGSDADISNKLSFFEFDYLFFIYFPVIYGIVFFILGFVFTPIINLILKIIKGLDLDIEFYEEHKAYQPQKNYSQTYPQNPQQQNYSQGDYPS
jgi:hypothetical protein